MFDADFSPLIAPKSAKAIPLLALTGDEFEAWRKQARPAHKTWAEANGFKAAAGGVCVLPADHGGIAAALAGLGEDVTGRVWDWSAIFAALPAGAFKPLVGAAGAEPDAAEAERAFLGRLLAGYRYDRFKRSKGSNGAARIVVPKSADPASVRRAAQGIWLVRDLINESAGHLGPAALAAAARKLARRFKARCSVIAGDDLLKKNYPAVHAVGRASADKPRLIDIRWGDPKHPKITLVGKGVCFDTGGLGLKSALGMKLMKKDMGGAAHVLALGAMVMDAGLPVRLRVLVPAVENAVAGNAMRPLDVVPTRSGLTIEIGHTDAEGRVILADALYEAASEKPAMIIDCATLTGAARVALGTEVPALFANDDALAAELLLASGETGDPLWRLPLWQGYAKMVDGSVADVNNAPAGGYGGAITAALFLERFVTKPDKKAGDVVPAWAHIDMMAWNTASKPGRPEGGEAMGLRAMFHCLDNKFA